MTRGLGLVAALAVIAPGTSAASPLLAADAAGIRKTSAKDLAVTTQREVLPNGLVLLMSPDPHVRGVVVDMSFAAGALYEPPDKQGLAHLVEHLLGNGTTPETDYRAMLESRGATGFNAFTTIDRMSFRVEVPPEELPLALWVSAERLGSLPAQLAPEELRRVAAIIAAERQERVDDVPYGKNTAEVMRQLFPPQHPLAETMLGTVQSLARLTLTDVLAFTDRLLVPANGVLTLTGHFDPAVAREWAAKTVGKLPAGEKASPPKAIARLEATVNVSVSEPLGRRPRVTLAWLLADPLREVSDALTFGALLLTLYTDGFVGMNVSADFEQFVGGALFELQVTMPHAASQLEVGGNAEVVLRNLIQATMPLDVVNATFQAWDRLLMHQLESPAALATFLTDLEVHPWEGLDGVSFTERHWLLTPDRVRALSGTVLRGPRVVVQSRPTHPLPPKWERH